MNSLESTIPALRVLVGYLGEKNQANWWKSGFSMQRLENQDW
jgi:hypothetical protein